MTVRDLRNLLDEVEDDSLEIVIQTDIDGGDIIVDFELQQPEYDGYTEDEDEEDDNDFKDAVVIIPTEFY